jgi:hypothetical protein
VIVGEESCPDCKEEQPGGGQSYDSEATVRLEPGDARVACRE